MADSRNNNLVVFDITESDSPDTATRIYNDNEGIKDVLTAINCEQFEVMETHRLEKRLSTDWRETGNIQKRYK